METGVAVTTCIIVVARIMDVSLDTVRTVSIVQGRRVFAACLGFFQALIYILAIAKVLEHADRPAYAGAYAVGFALGTYLGILVEARLAFGNQVAALYTRKGRELARALTDQGYLLAHVHEHLRNGEMSILYVEVRRRHVERLIRDAGAVDEQCYCVVSDVRMARFAAPPGATARS